MKKTICVSLTNRTNYSKLKAVLFELSKYDQVVSRLVLSSSILLERYGSGFKDLEKDGLVIDKKIECVLMNDSHEAMAKTIGLSVIEHASYFESCKPSMLIIVGDRYDMLAPAVAAGTMNIPISHIQGGELSGTIDNVIRDVLTRFSSLHFVATEKSMQNLIDFGINEETVCNYGCPAVEYITKLDIGNSFEPTRISKKFKNPILIDKGEKYFLVMVHPDTTDENDVEMDKVLEIIGRFKLKTFIFYPNIDANNTRIVASIAKFKNNDQFYFIRHMPLEDFVHTMAHCVCMIGNSSSGIRESASFATPFINIGNRQIGRERNKNTIDIGDDYDSLESIIKRCMDLKLGTENIYYKSSCSKRIAAKIVNFISI
jgi:UDP-hydrolysing UDP-N-acetyl-D-glucosamine 2-epimerase